MRVSKAVSFWLLSNREIHPIQANQIPGGKDISMTLYMTRAMTSTNPYYPIMDDRKLKK
jgi:hypothetical protein